jgi:hypothetical protein
MPYLVGPSALLDRLLAAHSPVPSAVAVRALLLRAHHFVPAFAHSSLAPVPLSLVPRLLPKRPSTRREGRDGVFDRVRIGTNYQTFVSPCSPLALQAQTI